MVLSNTDRDLLRRCLGKEAGAWEEFVDRYLPLITHVVVQAGRRRLGAGLDAYLEDLISEVMLALVDRDYAVLRNFRGQSSLGTYLVVIARRVAVKRLSKIRPANEKTLHRASEEVIESDDRLAIEGSREEVQELLEKMPTEQASLIRMFHLEKQSYSQIGHHLGIPENSVGPLLSKAREAMREIGDS